MMEQKYKNIIELVAPGIYAIYTTPSFAIGQRAHLIISPAGNILWDCITYLDASTIALVRALGGIKAMAISHPHYFSTIVEWSDAFENVPVYIHSLDAEWLGRKSNSIVLWQEDRLQLWNGMQLVRTGGHFPGASILYTPQQEGILFTGDTIQVSPDLKTVSFMYSYPNMIPLPKKDIIGIRNSVKSLRFNSVYGAFGHYIRSGAKNCVDYSIERYLRIFE